MAVPVTSAGASGGDIWGKKKAINALLTNIVQDHDTVQAGTPRTVQGEGSAFAGVFLQEGPFLLA